MKAVIMAGGEGKRLKAVTGDMPKPLVSLCGRSVMEHIILLLRRNGITDICAALKYRPEAIKNCFGDGERFGVRLSYRIETEALGTAGGVKNCADFYGDEDFLVISGDAACDFELMDMIKAHKENAAAVTLALYRHSEPLRYGLCLRGSDSLVRSFIEKPDWPHVVTNLVNTGIYVISPRAMEAVPEGRTFDFAKDLFPLLLERGERLLGYEAEGYWCDIGTPLSYYQCCVDALSGRLKLSLAGGFEVQRAEENRSVEPSDGETDCSCDDRARLMGSLSGAFSELGADFSDGFVFRGDGYELRINPLPDRAALRIHAQTGDAETARELCQSARRLAEELEKRLD